MMTVVLLATLTGCPPQSGINQNASPLPPRTTAAIVSTINDNAAKLDRALWAGHINVNARIRDDRKKPHEYNLEGTLLFRAPRDLRIDLRHALSERVMGIGSNESEYWVWIEPDLGLLRWGRHVYADKPCAEKIPVRPDQLAAILGFGGLPGPGSDLVGPTRKSGREFDILAYSKRMPANAGQLNRKYFIDRKPPHLVRLVAFYDEFGRRVMSAMLDDHRPAWKDGPLVPHQINISWPADDGNFNLSALAIEGRTTVSPRAFNRPTPAELPSGVRDVIQVDAACDTQTPTAPAN
ncbi:MAG: hypothetical protein HZA51_05790 [Planctomycetes bacterium]|nr:hypothetical protein [Planctomycetota bacterium]